MTKRQKTTKQLTKITKTTKKKTKNKNKMNI